MTTWNHNKGFIPRTQALFCSKGSFLHAATVVREQGLIHLQITWQQKWSTEFMSSKWRSIFHWVPYRCPVARILTRFKVKVSSYQTYHKMNHLPKVNSLIFCNTFASVGGCVPWASKPVPFHGASQAILHKETLILAVDKKRTKGSCPETSPLVPNPTPGSSSYVPLKIQWKIAVSENGLSVDIHKQFIAHIVGSIVLHSISNNLCEPEQPNMLCCTSVQVFSSSCASSSFCCIWTEINSAKNLTI